MDTQTLALVINYGTTYQSLAFTSEDALALMRTGLIPVSTHPNIKNQPFIRLVFFAYSRVFAGILEDSCGLQGFKKSHKFSYFFSLPIILSTPTRLASAKSASLCFLDDINQSIMNGLIKCLIFSIGYPEDNSHI
ncbi:hypothetical protein [Nitrosomonas ureae]|uniref:Uncharacterized protein n=1 Tax=Nitrosomonas ureae TaxID=44577 RepID=A0A1H5W7P8_9PROT|nr:hypothetical protein [Nitrosomonas ureae]SEF95430.1 hypothetical protein SAMN05216334_1171 [Nitrosomonas ureae]